MINNAKFDMKWFNYCIKTAKCNYTPCLKKCYKYNNPNMLHCCKLTFGAFLKIIIQYGKLKTPRGQMAQVAKEKICIVILYRQ